MKTFGSQQEPFGGEAELELEPVRVKLKNSGDFGANGGFPGKEGMKR